jgi:hypothetical protein
MSAGRLLPVSLTAAVVVAACSGCQAPSWTGRAPDTAEVKTHVEGGRAPQVAARELEPTSGHALPAGAIEEASPLPPALERPAPGPAATPLLDEALARAEARKGDLIEVLAQEDSLKPPLTLALATPIPKPAPAPPKVEPPPAKPPEPPPKTPEETWREGIQTLRAVAKEHLQGPRSSPPSGPNWAVRDRLLAWLAEPDIDPDARTAADAERGRAVLKGLAVLIDPTSPSAGRGPEIREAVAALESAAPLEIADLKPCRMVHGFGNVEPLEPAARKPGQSVVLYSEINGLAYEPAGSSFRSRVEGTVELFGDGSDKPAWSHPLPMVEDTCRKRRRDYFIGHKFTLPDDLPPGNYRLRLTQKDLVAGQVATRETAIAVVK